MRVFVAGDTHGNAKFLCGHLFPEAARLQAEVIVQVGDFGYWEHEPAGVRFLDQVQDTAERYGIPLYWLAGNHDKWSLAMARYGTRRTADGLVPCRPLVMFMPHGYLWSWAGRTLRAFGGAYSIDKPWRLELEAKREARAVERNFYREQAGESMHPLPATAASLWFPEEEMSDEDMSVLLAADSSPLDVVFSHDKPRAANPGIALSDGPEFRANQLRLQRALQVHRPAVWIHGHLHHRYADTVVVDPQSPPTTVIGLGCDPDAARGPYRPSDAWCLLDLEPDRPVRHTAGRVAARWTVAA